MKIRNTTNEPVLTIHEKYNKNGKLLYYSKSNGHEEEYLYDGRGNVIWGRLNDLKYRIDYDEYNNPIAYVDTDGYEYSVNKTKNKKENKNEYVTKK